MSRINLSKSRNEFVIENGILVKYLGDSNSVVIPGGVTKIGNDVFCANKTVESVVIPDGVTEIGDRAFCYCESLKHVSVPDSVIEYGLDAFTDSRGLADENGFVIYGGILYGYYGDEELVRIPQGVTHIGNKAFFKRDVRAIVIPHGVTTIGHEAFYKCVRLGSIEIPSTVEKIGAQAFCECSFLNKVDIPEGVTNIERRTFASCMMLDSITLPKSLRIIGDEAFLECKSLKTIELSDEIVEIGSRCFEGCLGLQSISVPPRVKEIKSSTFQNCRILKKVTLSEGLTIIGGSAFAYCRSLEEITFPASLEEIVVFSFMECKALKTMVFKNSVKRIDELAFYMMKTSGMKVYAKHLNSVPKKFCEAAVACFPEIYNDCSDDEKAEYFAYLRRRSYAFMNAALKDLRLLKLMVENDCLTFEMVEDYLKNAEAQNNIEAKTLLMGNRCKNTSDSASGLDLGEEIGIKGKTFAVSGFTSYPTYDEDVHFIRRVAARIRNNGGIYVDEITEETDYLVSYGSDSYDEKYIEARSLGVRVITERELKNMIGK